MSETVAMASAAPALIEVGNQSVQMAPLHLKAMGQFERFVQERLCESARRIASPDVAEHLLRRIAAAGFWSEEAASALRTVEGQVYVLWLGVQIAEPKIELAWMRENLTREQLRRAMDAYMRLNYPEVDDSKKDAAAGAGG